VDLVLQVWDLQQTVKVEAAALPWLLLRRDLRAWSASGSCKELSPERAQLRSADDPQSGMVNYLHIARGIGTSNSVRGE